MVLTRREGVSGADPAVQAKGGKGHREMAPHSLSAEAARLRDQHAQTDSEQSAASDEGLRTKLEGRDY